ncbi:MAG: hypothetical protein RXR16_07400 [Thermocladium sp.]
MSGSTNVKIGGSASISGTGFVASAFFSPTTGSYQYYLHCDVKPAAAGNVYFTFIISNGTWTWVQYCETSISSTTSITGVYVIGPKTYWTSGNYVYACAAMTPGGFNQVGTTQISSGTTSEGTSHTPSTTWYPLSPAPTNLDTQSWYSQRSTAAQVLTAGGGDLILLSGGSTYYVANPTLPSLGVAPLINGTPSAPVYDLYPVGGGGVESLTVSSGGYSLPIRSWEWLGSAPLPLMIGGSPSFSSPFLYPTQSLSSGEQVPTYLNGVNTIIIGKAGGSLTPTTLRIWSASTAPTASFPITINGTTFNLLNNSLIYVSMGDSMAPQASMTYYIPLNPVIGAGGITQLDMGSGTLLYVGPPGATTLQRMMVMNSSAGLSLATFTAPISFTFVNGTTLSSTSFTFNEMMIGSINGFIDAGGTLIEPNLAIMNHVGWVALAPHGTTSRGVLYITESEEATGFTGGTTLIGVVSGYWGPSVWLNATLASGIQQGQYSTAYISYPTHLQYSFASFLALNPATAATSSATSQLGPTIYITLGGSSANIPGSTVSVVVSTAAPLPLPINPIPLAIHMDTTTSIVVYGAIFALVILLIRKGGDLGEGLMVGGSILLILGIILGLMSFLVPATIILTIGMARLMMKKPHNNETE